MDGAVDAEKARFQRMMAACVGFDKGLNGGRDRDRTCDPLDVNEVLSR
jgi:hypothetical protein